MSYNALLDFEDTTSKFIGALNAFSEDDFNTKRSDGGWSAGQVAQHMNLSHGLGSLLRGDTIPSDRNPAEMIPGLEKLFLDFDQKLQSPEFVVPEDKIYGKADLIASLTEKFNDTKMAIRDSDLQRTCTGFILPGSSPMTGLEWVYFLVFHTQRHTEQLKRLAVDIGRP